jgi:hypothetical protein
MKALSISFWRSNAESLAYSVSMTVHCKKIDIVGGLYSDK